MNLSQFRQKIQQNNVVFAYPTEAVYGLGCKASNEPAVARIGAIKQRKPGQRYIVIASDWEMILPLIQPLDEMLLVPVKASWPGPFTWVFPAAKTAPRWLVNENNTIALRLTAHPIAKQLCEIAGEPLISTSANLSGQPPCRNDEETQAIFGTQLDFIIEGPVGTSNRPTVIRDVLTGLCMRN